MRYEYTQALLINLFYERHDMPNSEIKIPHRDDLLSTEEASQTITEALELVHVLIGSYSDGQFPPWLIARAHRFFSVQNLPGERNRGCGCDACYVDRLAYLIGEPPTWLRK